jgi:hypothetical protein
LSSIESTLQTAVYEVVARHITSIVKDR